MNIYFVLGNKETESNKKRSSSWGNMLLKCDIYYNRRKPGFPTSAGKDKDEKLMKESFPEEGTVELSFEDI